MGTNLTGAYLASQISVRSTRDRGWGRIVVISAAEALIRTGSVYGLAKAGIIYFVEALAVQVAPEVTVNAVAPGQLSQSAPTISDIDPTYVPRALDYAPLGRLITRKEVAQWRSRILNCLAVLPENRAKVS